MSPSKLYIQTLLFCNQRCAHCCYDCGPERTEFMSLGTFRAAVRMEPQAFLNIGGGEPTCHPLFWEFLREAINARDHGRIWLATNGKLRDAALRLAQLTIDGVLTCRLSAPDKFHEPVDPEVRQAFSGLRGQDYRMAMPIRQGRWKDAAHGRDACNCSGAPFVQWDGKVRQCGCLDAPVIGDVHGGYEPMFDGEETWSCAFRRHDPNGGKKK